jgi:pyruvate dehydrogenase kinase 2/3/4
MAGLGFGLPLAEVYTRYFGGEVDIISTFGCGTDVYLKLDRTGSEHEHITV